MTYVRIIAALAILTLGVFVALSPSLAYAPTPRNILYLLIAILPAILLAGEATAQFQLQLPGFVATAGGTAAFVLILLVLLTHFTKPDHQIGVYEVVDQQNQPLRGLDRTDAVQVARTASGDTIKPLVDGNSIVLIFPEQSPVVDLLIRPASNGPVYRGKVSYTVKLAHPLKLKPDFTIAEGN